VAIPNPKSQISNLKFQIQKSAIPKQFESRKCAPNPRYFRIDFAPLRDYNMDMSDRKREQFIQRVFQVVPAKFPLVKLSAGDEPFSVRFNGHVVSLENLFRLSELRPDDVDRQIERWVVELLRAAEGMPDRDGSFEDLRSRIFPMVVPDDDGPYRQTLMQPLVEGLNIAYALDNDRTISYLRPEQLEEWNVTLDEVHETAMKNLISASESMPARTADDEDGNIKLIIFQTGDGYDASRILLPTLHDRLVEYLGSPFSAAIPNRDILLCFRNDPELVEQLRKQIEEDFNRLPHQLTRQLLLVTPDGIAAGQ